MRHAQPVLLSLLIVSLAACGGTPRPREEKTDFVYRYTRATMWEQVRAEVRKGWPVAEENEEAMTIKTGWDTRLAVMNTFGRRHRLEIVVTGTDEDGYQVAATQETERNTNEQNPQSVAEADWDPTESDGALASRFLFNFHRRVNPGEPWKEDQDR